MKRWKYYRTINGVLDDVVEKLVIEIGTESKYASSSETECCYQLASYNNYVLSFMQLTVIPL